MGSFTKLAYHVVFGTKFRQPTITKDIQPKFYEYIGGTVRGQKGNLVEVGGIEDHVHLLLNIPPTKSVSNFIRDLKSSVSTWVNDSKLIKQEFRWQKEYGAFTVSYSQVKHVQQYIQNQEEHHRKLTFKEEYVAILKRHNIQFEDHYLFEDENRKRPKNC